MIGQGWGQSRDKDGSRMKLGTLVGTGLGQGWDGDAGGVWDVDRE